MKLTKTLAAVTAAAVILSSTACSIKSTSSTDSSAVTAESSGTENSSAAESTAQSAETSEPEPVPSIAESGTAADAVAASPSNGAEGMDITFGDFLREYKYFLATGDTPPVFTDRTAWYVGPNLDIAAMERGAAHLIGEHDFKSFCMAASAEGKPTHRNVREISFHPETVMGENLMSIKVVGNAFLHSMVRTIVGTLVMVGRGQRKPEWVADVLQACDRCAAGENAPAAGLVFWNVSYDGVRDHI